MLGKTTDYKFTVIVRMSAEGSAWNFPSEVIKEALDKALVHHSSIYLDYDVEYEAFRSDSTTFKPDPRQWVITSKEDEDD